jgi:hypothetical protein
MVGAAELMAAAKRKLVHKTGTTIIVVPVLFSAYIL